MATSIARPPSSTIRSDAKYDSTHDDFMFVNVCLHCGNEAPYDSTWCSDQCRQLDSDEQESAPDSPTTLPALVPSASKSTCSTPPSSATNSPSPRGMISDLSLHEDPPRLDLGAPATEMNKFHHGGYSLPITMKSGWKLSYPELVAAVQDLEAKTQPRRPSSGNADLQFRRRASKPQTPAPLFYREKAAFVRSSPALGPTSPTKPTFWSPQLEATNDITSLSLPPLASSTSVSPTPVKTKNCGRPGCVGEKKRSRLSGEGRKARRDGQISSARRPSWTSTSASSALRPVTTYDSPASDILLSPRIRALRATEPSAHFSLDESAEDSHLPNHDDDQLSSSSSSSEDEHSHSAFACYLFSHLSEDKKRAIQARLDRASDEDEEAPAHSVRGRRSAPIASTPCERSISVDSAALAKRPATTIPSASRPTRFLFARGPQPPVTPPEAPAGEDSDRTIRSRQATVRPKIEPGHFISATIDSPCDSSATSPLPSTPSSPPTAGRGRSVTRRPSVSDTDVLGDLPSGIGGERGRSNMRGVGAVMRSVSPSARGTSSHSSSRTRQSSRSRARESESRGRGRSTRPEELAEVAEDDEQGRGRSRARSSSAWRQRGYETVISAPAYGWE